MTQSILVSHEGVYGIEESIKRLKNNESGLSALEHGIRLVEDDHRARTVGFGGAPNLLGQMECDASVMRGDNLKCASVGAIKGCKYPISAAVQLLEALPHVFLVGEGASRFAREKKIPESTLLSPEAQTCYLNWLTENKLPHNLDELKDAPLIPHVSFDTRRDISKGTVTFLVLDNDGNIFGGVSTSGWAYKYPGRLGDSPIIGAGMYVDNRYGGAACTNTGEMTIRAGTARSVVLYMKKGATLHEACNEAIQDLHYLKDGYIGPVIIHGIDTSGATCVMTTGGDDDDRAYTWNDSLDSVQEIFPEIVLAG